MGRIRAADECRRSDTQDNAAHAVAAHVSAMSGATRRQHATGLPLGRLSQPLSTAVVPWYF